MAGVVTFVKFVCELSNKCKNTDITCTTFLNITSQESTLCYNSSFMGRANT